MYSSQVQVQVQRGEKEKGASGSGTVGASGQSHRGEKEKAAAATQGYDPNYPGYSSQLVSGSSTPYTPETERVSPPPRQLTAPPRHLDLSALVATALETAMAPTGGCDEDILFDEAVRTPCPPGTEDDVEMRSPGGIDDLEAARRYLDEDEEDTL